MRLMISVRCGSPASTRVKRGQLHRRVDRFRSGLGEDTRASAYGIDPDQPLGGLVGGLVGEGVELEKGARVAAWGASPRRSRSGRDRRWSTRGGDPVDVLVDVRLPTRAPLPRADVMNPSFVDGQRDGGRRESTATNDRASAQLSERILTRSAKNTYRCDGALSRLWLRFWTRSSVSDDGSRGHQC